MKTLLSIQELRLRLGAFAFENLSLDVAEGEYLVLMGPSGCGKTTLLKVVAGLIEPDSSVISISGKPASDLPCHLRRVAYVPQHASLFPHLSVFKNIEFGVSYSIQEKDASSRIAELSKILDISMLLDRMPHHLSGGEAKRVALARALATNPLMLLLDEPLGMLDKPARDETADFLRKAHNRLGTATIHVTHDRDEARRLNTRCAVMFDGRIEQTGSFDNLLAHPINIAIANFLGVKNVFEAMAELTSDGSTLTTLFGEFHCYGSLSGKCVVRFAPEQIAIQTDKAGEWQVDSITMNGLVTDIELSNSSRRLSVQLLTQKAEDLTIGIRVAVELPKPMIISEAPDNA